MSDENPRIRKVKVLQVIAENPGMTVPELAEYFQVEEEVARQKMYNLMKYKLIRRINDRSSMGQFALVGVDAVVRMIPKPQKNITVKQAMERCAKFALSNLPVTQYAIKTQPNSVWALGAM